MSPALYGTCAEFSARASAPPGPRSAPKHARPPAPSPCASGGGRAEGAGPLAGLAAVRFQVYVPDARVYALNVRLDAVHLQPSYDLPVRVHRYAQEQGRQTLHPM